MKKAMSLIVLFAVLILSLSAHTDRIYDGRIGMKAPDFTVSDSTSVMSLEDFRGSYVVVSFWSSADPQSRIDAKRYDELAALIASAPQKKEEIRLLSVNFDRSERLFREIMRRDNFSAKTHFHVNGADADGLTSAYHLDSGYRTYLIDPSGRIIGVNPSPAHIKEIASI